jgi:GGDEF domain-containing protein
LVDASTGLPNRAGFETELAQQVLQLRQSGQNGVLLWLRLDGAMAWAQRLGREAFENQAIQLSAALSDCLAKGESISRLDDSTYAIIASQRHSAAQAQALASQVLARSMAIGETRGEVTVRIVMLPLPAGSSSAAAAEHACEKALSSTAATQRIVKLRANGEVLNSGV